GGGSPVPLATISTSSVRGTSWGTGGSIVVGRVDGGLAIVSDAGGNLARQITADSSGEVGNHRWPLAIPGTDRFIYTASVGGQLVTSSLWSGNTAGERHALNIDGTMPLAVIDDQL